MKCKSQLFKKLIFFINFVAQYGVRIHINHCIAPDQDERVLGPLEVDFFWAEFWVRSGGKQKGDDDDESLIKQKGEINVELLKLA